MSGFATQLSHLHIRPPHEPSPLHRVISSKIASTSTPSKFVSVLYWQYCINLCPHNVFDQGLASESLLERGYTPEHVFRRQRPIICMASFFSAIFCLVLTFTFCQGMLGPVVVSHLGFLRNTYDSVFAISLFSCLFRSF